MAICNKAAKWCRDIGCFHAFWHKRCGDCVERECKDSTRGDPTVRCRDRKKVVKTAVTR